MTKHEQRKQAIQDARYYAATPYEFEEFGALVCGQFWDSWKPTINPACLEEEDEYIPKPVRMFYKPPQAVKVAQTPPKKEPAKTPPKPERVTKQQALYRSWVTEKLQRNALIIQMYQTGYTLADIMERHELTSGEVSHIIYTNGAIDE